MSKYYKEDDVLAIFSEEERPLNWTDSEAEIQAQNDFDCYKGMIESLPTIDIVRCKDCKWLLAEEGGCERIGMVLFADEIETHFCGYGERIDNE